MRGDPTSLAPKDPISPPCETLDFCTRRAESEAGSIADRFSPIRGGRPFRGPGHEDVKRRVFDRVVRIRVVRKMFSKLLFDFTICGSSYFMRPQVVPTKQWVALIETPAFSDMKIRRTVPVLIESLCKFLTGQGEPRRTVICRRLAKFKTDCFDPLIRVVG